MATVPEVVLPWNIWAFVLLICGAFTYYHRSRRGNVEDGIVEPPYIYPSIPFVGHILGMMRFGGQYFRDVNKPCQHPIFTLPMLNMRNYIVTDAGLAGKIQRNSTSMSFYALVLEVTRRMIAFDKEAMSITYHNLHVEQGKEPGLMMRVHDMVNRHLAPGPSLNRITAIQLSTMGDMLNQDLLRGTFVVDLYEWQRHILSVSNMKALYGPRNIFATSPELESAFWDFEKGLLGLLVDIVPSLTARRAYMARQRVLSGLIEYVRERRYEAASALIQERVKTNLEVGLSEHMTGHAELVLVFGILGNAVPSNFWLIANIFSRPALLQRVREEVQSALSIQHPGAEDGKSLEVSKVLAKNINMTSCPILYSCYRETLREIANLLSVRLVLEDTIVADKYLLRENSMVQIAGGILGRDPTVWGPNSGNFDPYRFLMSNKSGCVSGENTKVASLPDGVPSAAFRAFGGGTVICPGRHFAQTELMLFAASMVLAFDVYSIDGGPIELPDKDEAGIPLTVLKPIQQPLVRLARRSGWESIRLSIDVA